MNKQATEQFGEKLKKLLKEQGLSQEEFSDKIFADKNTISNYIRGKTTPKMDTVIAIARYFEVSTDYLLGHYLEVPISEIGELFDGSLKRKCGIRVVASRNSPLKLQCFRYQSVGDLKLYPLVEDVHRRHGSNELVVVQEENYSIINGNIYNATSNYRGELAISIYDYVSSGKRIKQFTDAYKVERHTLGLIGTLSADEFYLLILISF